MFGSFFSILLISITCLSSLSLCIFSQFDIIMSVRMTSLVRSFLKYSRCSYFKIRGMNFLLSNTILYFFSFLQFSIARCLQRFLCYESFKPHLQSCLFFSFRQSEQIFSLHLLIGSYCNSKYSQARAYSVRLQMAHLKTASILYMSNFRTDVGYLNERLFRTGRARYGMETSCLNVHYLPDFLAYTKESLTEKQRICLIDYELESLLMELATLRASEISGMTEVSLLRSFVLNLLRSNSSFWVRNSTIWNQIQGNHEDAEVGLKAMESYTNQMKKPLFDYHSEQPQLKPFEPISQRLVTNNCQKFMYPQPNNTFQRISLKLLLHLKQYLQIIRPTQQLQLQHFLIDFLYCSQKRRRKKKQPIDWQVNRNDQFMIFSKFAGQQQLATCINDINVEQMIITNVIKAHRNQIIKVNSEAQFSSLIDSIQNGFWTEQEAAKIYTSWYNFYKNNQQKYQQVSRQNKARAEALIPGCVNTIEQIEKVFKSWQSLQQNPDFKNLSKYKFHSEKRKEWQPADYKKFLEGLLLYLDQPVNNKKIAQHINKDFEPNHVKHVKGIYLRNLKQRMDNGECGGGQFGDCLSKKQFIQKDLENFNMKWFNKTKLAKRRRKLADSDEASSSWECR